MNPDLLHEAFLYLEPALISDLKLPQSFWRRKWIWEHNLSAISTVICSDWCGLFFNRSPALSWISWSLVQDETGKIYRKHNNQLQPWTGKIVTKVLFETENEIVYLSQSQIRVWSSTGDKLLLSQVKLACSACFHGEVRCTAAVLHDNTVLLLEGTDPYQGWSLLAIMLHIEQVAFSPRYSIQDTPPVLVLKVASGEVYHLLINQDYSVELLWRCDETIRIDNVPAWECLNRHPRTVGCEQYRSCNRDGIWSDNFLLG